VVRHERAFCYFIGVLLGGSVLWLGSAGRWPRPHTLGEAPEVFLWGFFCICSTLPYPSIKRFPGGASTDLMRPQDSANRLGTAKEQSLNAVTGRLPPTVRLFCRSVMIFPEALKKRGVGMAVGAPSSALYTHASDGFGWSSGDEGPSLKPYLIQASRYRQLESERLLCRIARFVRLSGKLATMAPH
jgi:hypothetical protein